MSWTSWAQDFMAIPRQRCWKFSIPNKNATFRDNYLPVAFDLSKVLFIGTANIVDNIPPAGRDRMEISEMPGYIEDEKLAIAQRYLIKRQLVSAGLTREKIKIK